MGIMREYQCKGHGIWQTTAKIVTQCPAGCSKFERYFSAPPGYVGQKTRNNDRMTRDIAASLGLSDMSNRNGESVMANYNKKYPAQSQSFAMKPGTAKAPVTLGDAIKGTGMFQNQAPKGVVQNSFGTARESFGGSMRRETAVMSSCDSTGKITQGPR